MWRRYVYCPNLSEDEQTANEKVCFAAFVALYSELVPEELYLNSCPYDFEYFQWFVPCLKEKDTADKLTAILCQNPTAFMELYFAKSDGRWAGR